MGFNPTEKAKLLAECHRRCCICHKFCGVNIELNHIIPKEQGGPNDIENAIPLCFECHAEVRHYNVNHPKGNKFSAAELKLHKQQWLDICANHPESLIGAPRNRDVGPLEGLVQELNFNLVAIEIAAPSNGKSGVHLKSFQYDRAITEGAIMLLPSQLIKKINEAYVAVEMVTVKTQATIATRPTGNDGNTAQNNLKNALDAAINPVREAREDLIKYLNPTSESEEDEANEQ